MIDGKNTGWGEDIPVHQTGDESVGFSSDIFTEKIPLFKFLEC